MTCFIAICASLLWSGTELARSLRGACTPLFRLVKQTGGDVSEQNLQNEVGFSDDRALRYTAQKQLVGTAGGVGESGDGESRTQGRVRQGVKGTVLVKGTVSEVPAQSRVARDSQKVSFLKEIGNRCPEMQN